MIDYDSRRWVRAIFRWNGSVLPALLPRIVVTAVIGTLAVWLYDARNFKLPSTAHNLLGVALGLLLVFRTNASYGRYWDGRAFFGQMVNRTRDLARQSASFLDAERAEIVRLLNLWFGLVVQHLRGERDLTPLGGDLRGSERAALESVHTRHLVVAGWISTRLAAAHAEGRLAAEPFRAMESNVTALIDAVGGAERILRTPVPFAYAQHIKTFLMLFCFTIPFALVESMHRWTPLASAAVAYCLFGIEEIGVEIEDPFGYDPNDLPLERIGDTIRADTHAVLVASLSQHADSPRQGSGTSG